MPQEKTDRVIHMKEFQADDEVPWTLNDASHTLDHTMSHQVMTALAEKMQSMAKNTEILRCIWLIISVFHLIITR